MNNLLEVRNLNITYKKDEHSLCAVRDISFSLGENKTLGIIGESGSGKTSIANAIMNILPKQAHVMGSILYKGRDITSLKEKEIKEIMWDKIAIIFQNSLDVLNPVLTVGLQISEVLVEHKGYKKNKAKEISKEYLEKVGLSRDIYDYYPHELSGGMRQRVLIAMALVCQPEILIADEVTSALDAKSKKEILELIFSLQEEFKFSLLLISHELDTIARLTKELIVLYKGEILEKGITKEILDYQYHPYSRGLINSSSDLNIYKDLWGIPRKTSNEEILGCPFYQRCTQRSKSCNERKAKLKKVSENRYISCHKGGILNLLTCEDVSKTYKNKNRIIHACIDCSFHIRQGEFISIIGESGSGKTTLANIITGVIKKDKGRVTFNDIDINKENFGSKLGGIQIVFQDPFSSINENFTVEDAIKEPLVINGMNKDISEKIKEYLEKVELDNSSDFLKRRIHTLSGGQRQRVSIARSLIMNPSLLVADEICSMLDKSTEANILRLLKKLQNEEGFAMIYITHNLSIALKLSDRILVMNEGRIVESGNAIKVIKNPKNNYTKELIKFNKENEEVFY